jgi:hypothetical protein
VYGGGERRVQGFWWGNLRKKDNLGEQGIDGMIILKRILGNGDVRVWTGLSWLRLETDGGHL